MARALRSVVVVLWVSGSLGCGGAPAREGAAPASAWESGGDEEAEAQGAQPMVVGWEAELSELVDRLESETVHHATALHAGRCDDGEELAERICGLAERICEIAESHAAAQPRCDDAETRCASARERVADECNR